MVCKALHSLAPVPCLTSYCIALPYAQACCYLEAFALAPFSAWKALPKIFTGFILKFNQVFPQMSQE